MLSHYLSETYQLDSIGASAYPPWVTFAELVKTLRAIRGWSQIELARRADLNPQTIHRIEHGTMNGGWTSRNKIARVFGISLDELPGATAVDDEPQSTNLSGTTLAAISEHDLLTSAFAIVRELERRSSVQRVVQQQNKVAEVGRTPTDGSNQSAETLSRTSGETEMSHKEPPHVDPVPERDSIPEGPAAFIDRVSESILTDTRKVEKHIDSALRARARKTKRRRRVR